MEDTEIFVGKAEEPVYLSPKYVNRHGLIAGATGTGKTVSLQILAEGLSRRRSNNGYEKQTQSHACSRAIEIQAHVCRAASDMGGY